MPIQAVVLVRQGTLSRTTSGKVQRNVVCEQFLGDTLRTLAQWIRTSNSDQLQSSPADDSPPDSLACRPAQQNRIDIDAANGDLEQLAAQIESRLLHWLRDRLGESVDELFGASEDELDPHRPFADFGLDSVAAVELSCELENWLDIRVLPIVAWNCPTPASLAVYLAHQAVHVNSQQLDGEDRGEPLGPGEPGPHHQADLPPLVLSGARLTGS